MKKLFIFIDNKYTLFRYDYLYLSEITDQKVLIYPQDQLSDIKTLDKFDQVIGVECSGKFEFDYGSLFLTLKNIKKELVPLKEIILITIFELYNEIIGRLRDELHLGGMGVKVIEKFRNKNIMRSLIEENSNLKLPKTKVFDHNKFMHNKESYFNELKTEFGCPMIIKDFEGAGNLNVFLINHLEGFPNLNQSKNFLVQEYLDAVLFHVDFVIYKQEVIFFDVCQLSIPQLKISQMAKFLYAGLPVEDLDLKNRIKTFTEQVIISLNCEDSCYHLEVFLTKAGELVFLEIGARPGGGRISNMYEIIYGTSLFKLHVQVLSNTLEEIKNYSKVKNNYAFWFECDPNFDINILDLKGSINIIPTPYSQSIIIFSSNKEILGNDFKKIVDCSLAQLR